MRRLNQILATFILIAILYFLASGFFRKIPSTSALRAEFGSVGFYQDTTYDEAVDSIDWGSLSPGSSKKFNVYIKNEGDSDIRLSLKTIDWEPPAASKYMKLDWNYTGRAISPDEATRTTLTLSVSPVINVITTFSFNILIPVYSRENTPSISDIGYCMFCAPTDSVYYVPTGNIYDDSALYAFYAYNEYPQILTSPMKSSAISSYLDQDGRPLFTGNIVTFGGRYANLMVRYYEDREIAKVGFSNNGTHHIFTRVSDGVHLYAINSTTYNEKEKDYFVFQMYKDEDRYIFSEWGICPEGTYAGGLCFIDNICPNLIDYTDQYYIFSWTDLNDDDMPQPEEIALETSGS